MTPIVDLKESLERALGREDQPPVKTRKPSKPKKPLEPSPAYQWYPRDDNFEEGVAALDNEAYGLHRRLWDHAWLNNGLPEDPLQIWPHAREPRLPKFKQLWMRIESLWPPSGDGRRRNPRQEERRASRDKFRRKCQLAALSQWEKKRSQATANPDGYPYADPSGSLLPPLCSALASALSSADHDQEQAEQRDERRAPHALKPARMRAIDPAKRTLYDLRKNLLAACYRLMDAGAPFVDADLRPDATAIEDALKFDIVPKFGITYDNGADLKVIVDSACANRLQQLANMRYRAGRQARDRRAIAGLRNR